MNWKSGVMKRKNSKRSSDQCLLFVLVLRVTKIQFPRFLTSKSQTSFYKTLQYYNNSRIYFYNTAFKPFPIILLYIYLNQQKYKHMEPNKPV